MARRRTEDTRLENFAPSAKTRPRLGHPTFLSDGDLWHRRDNALGHFEIEWPEWGWDLRRARTAADLNKIFAATEHTSLSEQFRRFRLNSSVPFDDLDLNRKKRKALSARIRDSYEAMREIADLKGRIDGAAQDINSADGIELEIAHQRFTRDWEYRRVEYERLSAEDEELRNHIEMQEAAFAQSELLRFVREKKYAWNPVNLADAVAGLGYMSYRQSISRCRRKKCKDSSCLQYEVFRAIAYLCEGRRPQQLLGELRERVLDLPRRFASAERELRRDFYFLRIAVDDSVRCNHRASQFAYAVARKFSRSTRSMSVLDQVRAYDQQLW